MIVKDLIENLKQLDGKKRVILSSDEEGNNFHNIGRIMEDGVGILIYPEHDSIELEL